MANNNPLINQKVICVIRKSNSSFISKKVSELFLCPPKPNILITNPINRNYNVIIVLNFNILFLILLLNIKVIKYMIAQIKIPISSAIINLL